jgi:hypothetical protein
LKNLLTFVILFFVASTASSQSVSVEPSIERIGKGYNAAYRIDIPHADPAFVEKEWRSFLKEHKGKVKGSKGEVNAEEIVIPALGSAPMRFLSDVDETSSGTLIRVAVERNQSFVAKATHPETASQLEGLFRRWSLDVALASMTKRIETTRELINKNTREVESLGRSTKRLEQSNESLRKQIEANEKTIGENNVNVTGLTKALEEQTRLLQEFEKKKSDLK